MAGGGGYVKEGHSAWEAASIVFRIVTVGLSLASAITTVASTQCVYDDDGRVASTATYNDYHSFRYAAAADLVSAVLQGVAIYLEAVRKEEAARLVEFIDELVQALTSTSAALLLAVGDITSCGPPSSRASGRRQRGSLCGKPGRFCGQIRVSSAFSLVAAASFSVAVYTRHAASRATAVTSPPKKPTTRPTVMTPPRTPSPELGSPSPPPSPRPPRRESTPPGSPTKPATPAVLVCVATPACKSPPPPERRCPEQPAPTTDGEEGGGRRCRAALTVEVAITSPPPYLGCPRLTIPCSCENPELCAAFF